MVPRVSHGSSTFSSNFQGLKPVLTPHAMATLTIDPTYSLVLWALLFIVGVVVSLIARQRRCLAACRDQPWVRLAYSASWQSLPLRAERVDVPGGWEGERRSKGAQSRTLPRRGALPAISCMCCRAGGWAVTGAGRSRGAHATPCLSLASGPQKVQGSLPHNVC